MAETFNSCLIKLLKKDNRFVDEDGELIKAAVIDSAWKIDKGLVRLLLSDKAIKAKFFDEIEGHWIFNLNTFIDFVSDKNFLDNSYTRFKNRIGLTIDGKYLKERGEVALAWPYKDCVLEGGQTKEEERRKEIFFNEVLAQDEIDRLLDPKVLTNFKRYTTEGEKAVTELKRDEAGILRENLVIKGNNLIALNTLKSQFRGKIKLVYIDPPYNREKDSFRYNDRFNHSAWLTFMKNRLEIARELLRKDGSIIVQCDDKEYAYLKVLMDEVFSIENYKVSMCFQVRYGKKTLAEDNEFQKVVEYGLIYSKSELFKPNKDVTEYSIDKFEWKITTNKTGEKITAGGKNAEVFKPGKYKIEKIKPSISGLKETWATGSLLRQKGSSGEFFNTNLAPRKNIDGLECLYKVYGIGEDGLGFRYFTGPKSEKANRGKFYSGIPLEKVEELKSGKSTKEVPIINFLDLAGDFGNCRHEGGVDIKGGKKPEKLLEFVLKHFSDPEDIVLDFYLGSGTTAAVAHKMNMQYIGVEQLDYSENDGVNRLQNVIGKSKKKKDKMFDDLEYDRSGISKAVNWQGGGDFVYCELMKYNEVYMEKIQDTKTSKELIKLWKEIAEKSFLNWYVNAEIPEEAICDFEAIGKEEKGLEKQKKLLCGLLNKNQLYVNLSEIDDKQFAVSKADKELNKAFYGEDF